MHLFGQPCMWKLNISFFVRTSAVEVPNLSVDITISLLIELVSDNTPHQVRAKLAELFQ